jgi:hypothetical protein
MRRRGILAGAVTAGAALVLVACDVGVTGGVRLVTDVSATLEGRVRVTTAGPSEAWFEYGTTVSYGSRTPSQTVTTAADGQQAYVSAPVSGLAEATTYHYRACARDEQGVGVCGADATFSTSTGRDSATGLGIVYEIPELGYVDGANLDVRGDASGASPEGTVSVSPGSHYFRIPDAGPITCFRVEGNRGVVGFVADATEYDPNLPLIPLLVMLEDNGESGDRMRTEALEEPATTCPVPDAAAPGWEALSRGGFTVHDHP